MCDRTVNPCELGSIKFVLLNIVNLLFKETTMNYYKHYNALIERARGRKLEGYKEKHHIIPRCMDGTNDSTNIVNLTAREHYLAHILLTKIYTNHYGLLKAAMMMAMCKSRGQYRHSRMNNRTYASLKERLSEIGGELHKGARNSQYNTMWISDVKNEKSCKISRDEPIPDGWVKGRGVWAKHDTEMRLEQVRKERSEKKEKDRANHIETLRMYHSVYLKKGYDGVVNEYGYKFSKQNLCESFARWLPEFIPQNGKKRAL